MLFNLSHLIHTPPFRVVNLLCCGGHFSNITFIDAKLKYRNPYLLDLSFLALLIKPYKDVSEGRPQDVSKTLPLELNI